MSKNWLIQTNSAPKRERVIKYPEYWKFVDWCAVPMPLRRPQTQKELAKELSVHEVTLSIWKKVEGFDEDRRKAIKEWTKEKSPNVIRALYVNILKNGNAAEVRLWLQWVEGWQEKSGIEQKIEVEEKLSEADKQELLDAFDLVFYGKKKSNRQ